MKILVVYYLDGKWFGEEATYKHSGSGYYGGYTRIDIPQSKAEIEQVRHRREPVQDRVARRDSRGSRDCCDLIATVMPKAST